MNRWPGLTLLLATACQASSVGHTGFGSTPEVTAASSASTSSTSANSPGSTTTADSGSGSSAAQSTSEPPRDLGVMPDFGDGAPVGCKGKIDFLFVISRQANMAARQAQLALAVPKFIATIESKFEDFDYHIMVITGDGDWGNEVCTQVCPTPMCKVGEDCCPWADADHTGELCCDVPDYPCQYLDLVTACDRTWGAGEVFPAGSDGEPNKPCPIDGGGRYLVKGQSDLAETFQCIASVGASGDTLLGQALTAAMQSNINDPGGCNPGFLRKDALLMVTLIATNPDEPSDSKGTPADWAKAVLNAKQGDDEAVVMFDIGGGGPECLSYDRICHLADMFPYHHHVFVEELDYGAGFAEAASLVETACAGFAPPG